MHRSHSRVYLQLLRAGRKTLRQCTMSSNIFTQTYTPVGMYVLVYYSNGTNSIPHLLIFFLANS